MGYFVLAQALRIRLEEEYTLLLPSVPYFVLLKR